MGLFDSILGKARSVSASLSRTVKATSPPSGASSISSMFRGREKSQPEPQIEARTEAPQPTNAGVSYAPTIQGVQVSQGVYDSFVSQGGIPDTVKAPALFSSIFKGAKPAIPALTFTPPSVPVGDAATVFEMIGTGQMTGTGAQAVLASRDTYGTIDRALGGILPGGEPFDFPDWGITNKVFLLALGLGLGYLVIRKI